MGGRAAEELIFGDVTTGAHNDIERSTMVARAMVCEYGMSKVLGPQNLGSNSQPVFMGQGMSGGSDFSENTAQLVDKEVHRILTEAYDTCMKILVDNKEQLITLSEILIEREVLDFKEVDSIMKTGKLPEEPEPKKEEKPAEDADPTEETTASEVAAEDSDKEKVDPASDSESEKA
jgi:cell division protease FtsH